MTAKDRLESAKKVLVDREEDYDSYEDMLALIADYWSTYLGSVADELFDLSESDVATMMGLFKIARSSVGDNAKTADDLQDALGYMAMASDMRHSEDLTSQGEGGNVFTSEVRYETSPNWAKTEESFENMVRKAVEDSDGDYEAGVDVRW